MSSFVTLLLLYSHIEKTIVTHDYVLDVPRMMLVKGMNQNCCTKLEMFSTLTMLEAFEYLFDQRWKKKFIVL